MNGLTRAQGIARAHEKNNTRLSRLSDRDKYRAQQPYRRLYATVVVEEVAGTQAE